jgi:aryl-alcohol dehydrogenase-like predicted oxidoreductase
MQYARMGRTGLKVSRLCLGTMTFGWSADSETSFRIMDRAFDAGINFFDTADVYSSWIDGNQGGEAETILGQWLKNKPRHELIIATKVRARMWPGSTGDGLSRQHIMKAVEDSLRRLQTDYIDLYQTHSPDNDTPLDETLRAMDDLVKAGKVRYVGCSNYRAWELMKALWVSDKYNLARYDCLQPHYSLFNRAEYERELEAVCIDQQVGVIPYSPLAAGFATGKYTRENRSPDTTRTTSSLVKRLVNDEHAYLALDVLQQQAEFYRVPVSQIALAWQLANPSITSPIIGARTVEQLEEVLGATEVTLSAEDITQIDKVTGKY